jgi:hypothetical protein
MSSYERVLYYAERDRETHHARMAANVKAHARRHPDLFQKRNGGLNRRKIYRRARRDWWRHPPLWDIGAPRISTLQAGYGVYMHGRLQAQTEEETLLRIRREVRGEPSKKDRPKDAPEWDEDPYLRLIRAMFRLDD